MSVVVQGLINKRLLSDKSFRIYHKIRQNIPRLTIKIQICSHRIRNSKAVCRLSSRLTVMDYSTITCIPTILISLTLFRVFLMEMPFTIYPFYRNNNNNSNSSNSNSNSIKHISFSHQYNNECTLDTTSINN